MTQEWLQLSLSAVGIFGLQAGEDVNVWTVGMLGRIPPSRVFPGRWVGVLGFSFGVHRTLHAIPSARSTRSNRLTRLGCYFGTASVLHGIT